MEERAAEIEVSVEDVENWLEENDSDPGYQVLSTDEIAESVLADDQPGVSSSSDTGDEMVVGLKNVSSARLYRHSYTIC